MMLFIPQEWPPELEAALNGSRLPTADLVSAPEALFMFAAGQLYMPWLCECCRGDMVAVLLFLR
jgi:hypothetical protein